MEWWKPEAHEEAERALDEWHRLRALHRGRSMWEDGLREDLLEHVADHRRPRERFVVIADHERVDWRLVPLRP